jgi:transcriptional regulator with XRE-family HTH domain
MKMVTDEIEVNNLAVNLRLSMQEKDWTQLDLERASGIRQPTISGILNKKNVPTIIIVSRLAKALSTSIDNLLSIPPQKKIRNGS